MLSVEIGSGVPLIGTFATIDWSKGPYFIKSETDPTGGTIYSISGVSQLLSVPYTLYAEKSGSSIKNNDSLVYNETQSRVNGDNNLKSKQVIDSSYFNGLINTKQATLTAGTGITING